MGPPRPHPPHCWGPSYPPPHLHLILGPQATSLPTHLPDPRAPRHPRRVPSPSPVIPTPEILTPVTPHPPRPSSGAGPALGDRSPAAPHVLTGCEWPPPQRHPGLRLLSGEMAAHTRARRFSRDAVSAGRRGLRTLRALWPRTVSHTRWATTCSHSVGHLLTLLLRPRFNFWPSPSSPLFSFCCLWYVSRCRTVARSKAIMLRLLGRVTLGGSGGPWQPQGEGLVS